LNLVVCRDSQSLPGCGDAFTMSFVLCCHSPVLEFSKMQIFFYIVPLHAHYTHHGSVAFAKMNLRYSGVEPQQCVQQNWASSAKM
jgi:hypothetical protein